MSQKSISLKLRVWYDGKSRHIKLASPDLTASTVSNDPSSKRYHPNLFGKLATALRNAGAPAPPKDALTPTEKGSLRKFLTAEIVARRDRPLGRDDMEGVQSGSLYNVLKLPQHHPVIAKKLKDRTGLVAEARELGFVINVGSGGSRRGTVAWESVDLPGQ